MMSPSDRATTPIVLHPANDVAVVCQDTGGSVFADTVFPARMLVDYIRIYQPEAA